MARSTRWTIKVSKETDASLRTYLGAKAVRKGDLSRFVEEAVRWRMFERTVQAVKARNEATPAAEIDSAIDQAVRDERRRMRHHAR